MVTTVIPASWAAMMAGKSGISRIRRFPTEKLRTTIAGTVDRWGPPRSYGATVKYIF